MKQNAFYLKTIDDLDACLQAFFKMCPEDHSAILVSVFSGWPEEQLGRLTERLRKALPEAVLVGCTSAGEILSGAMSEGTTILSFMVFFETGIETHIVDFRDTGPAEAAKSFRPVYEAMGPVAGLELLMAVNDTRVYEFLARLNEEVPSDLPVFGGVAGSTNGAGPYVFLGDQILREGIVILCFTGDELHIRVNTTLGWRPLGRRFTITGMVGENIITELDHQPASLVYKKYLTITQEDFGVEHLLFPLFLERNGTRLVRLPYKADSDGALSLSADCHVGEQVRLAFGDPHGILDASYEVRMDIMTFEPEAILLFSCVSRRVFLQEDTNQELRPFQMIAPNVGMYAMGEVGRQENTDLMILNMTLVSVGFREGGREESRPPEMPAPPPQKSLNHTMRLVQYLANFVTVTSAELEAANRQLTEMATLDRLTGLFNRGEIESILKKELQSQREGTQVLSAVMMDLDSFKKVNDDFGHAVGDQTLCWTASVLKRDIRRGDAAGRWGGEEFFIILPGASLSEAEGIAERIRCDLQEGYSLPDGRPITASLGVAEFPRDGDYSAFYRTLDAALYRAKQSGKNRVCVDGKEEETPPETPEAAD